MQFCFLFCTFPVKRIQITIQNYDHYKALSKLSLVDCIIQIINIYIDLNSLSHNKM